MKRKLATIFLISAIVLFILYKIFVGYSVLTFEYYNTCSENYTQNFNFDCGVYHILAKIIDGQCYTFLIAGIVSILISIILFLDKKD